MGKIACMCEYVYLSLKSVDSTSRYLKDYLNGYRDDHLKNSRLDDCPAGSQENWGVDQVANREPKIVVCCTQEQTAGYGQQGRAWLTNADSAIFSVALPLPQNQLIAPPTSIRVASSLQQCVQALIDEPVWVKWPNDLYDAKGKVAGILIEQVKNQCQRYLVIGVGINRGEAAALPLPAADYQASALPWFCLQALLEKWLPILQRLDTQSPLSDEELGLWQASDWFAMHETICLKQKSQKQVQTNERNQAHNQETCKECHEEPGKALPNEALQTATYCGLNEQGHVQLRINEQLTTLFSGVSSLRKYKKALSHKE